MASKTTLIPRFLLPQYGPMWRTTIRSAAFVRPLNADVGQVLVRYASRTATTKSTTAKSAVTKVAAPKAASTKSAASKAAKASAPTKPPAKSAAKSAAKTLASKAAAPQTAATPEVPLTPAAPVPATEPTVQAVAPKPTTTPTKPTVAPPAADPSKPIVLEKPERFNPPSHGARLPRSTPKHYGGPMTTEEVQAQSKKSYPGLPPPNDSWSHWFINSRAIHMVITLGTLTTLAVYTFAMNFKAKSPFADMIPPISEFPRHPFQYIGVCVDVLRMHEEHESALTAEKRRRRVEDVAKRNEYRKAHGLESTTGGLFGGKAEMAEQTAEAAGAASPVAVVGSSEPESELNAAAEFTPDGKRKKFMGIF
ncbi:hypothetical protein F5Y19DRAFT_43434 [Xylariaceae sp. FL1651]|nr:hypothetical protein F5Y19DRAFT_43434 [Xylariaceae sp. FL1651]